MDKYEIEKLRGLSIVGVAQRLGLRVNSHRKCLCPFHDDHHPSMSLGRNNKYRCFVCDAHGDVINLVMRLLSKSFPDACRWLADEHNVILTEYKPTETMQEAKPFDASRYERFFERPWLSPEARRFLFEERRLDERVVRWCRLTSWQDRQGVGWLQIPYYDRDGRLVGVQNRNLVKGALPRFRFPSGSECGIYNLPVLNLLRPAEPLYITEGCSDCWAMLSAGHKAIAIPSATLLGRKDVELLSTLNVQLSTQFHMYPDQDEPGERLFLQLKQVLPSLEHHHLPPGCKDFGEYFVKQRSLHL
jgi:DNA primase